MIDFSAMELKGWRQFDHVEIDLTKQATVLTGQNGCGKTTLLNILNRHFGWSLHFVATPYFSRKKNTKLWSDIYRPSSRANSTQANASTSRERGDPIDGDFEDIGNVDQSTISIGAIRYNDGSSCDIRISALVGNQYDLDYGSMQPVVGLHIPSHRPIASYTHVPNIPTDPKTATQEYQQYQQLLIQFYGGQRGENPGKIQKQSLISFAVFGEGNSAVTPNPEIKHHLDQFQEVLRKVLPKSLGFRRLEIRMPDVVLVTETGDFSLDAMSGGVNAVFSIAWQIHMFAQDKGSFTVTIDEPENHLHPSMQRTLLPNLTEAFPFSRFIISTHSPFVVSSFPEANIYALIRNERSRIVSHKLNISDVSGTPNEVLREILDVESNLPVWVEERIARVIQETEDLAPKEKARRIMEQLENLGIADSIVEFQRSVTNAPTR